MNLDVAVLKTWMESDDLRDRAQAYEQILASPSVIVELGEISVQQFVIQYGLDCIEANVDDDVILSRFEAADELSRTLKLWVDSPRKYGPSISVLIRNITSLYVKGDNKLRNAIETGFLEHAFEKPEVVGLFAAWERDPILCESFVAAKQWGESHR